MDSSKLNLTSVELAGMSLLLAAMIAGAAAVWAQGIASISGRAEDSSKAALPDARISVRNTETGESRTTVSDASGSYRLLALPVGKYEVRAEKDGFRTEVRNGITLAVGQEAVVNLSMEVGELLQQVTVNAEAPLVNTTTAETAGLVGEREVKDLPLNGRSFDNLITLNGGTVNFTSMHTSSSPVSGGIGNLFSVGGRRIDENQFLLNGVIYEGNGTQMNSPGSVSGQLLGIDAIREFNVLRDNYSAEYGKRAGGQIIIVTTGGTNQLHGSVFEFLRNSALDARNFFDYGNQSGGPRLPHFQRNNFGGALGGPIKKDKLFVFGNYEGFRQRLGLSNVAIVPDLNARQGLVPNAQGQLVSVGVAAGIAPYLSLWPLPNGPQVGGGAADYFNSARQTVREDFGTVRMDQNFSQKDSLSEVYTIDDGVSLNPQVAGNFASTLIYRAQVASLSEVHIFSPSLLSTLTLGLSRARFSFGDVALVNYPANLAFVQGYSVGQLTIGVSGGAASGALSTVGANAPTSSARNLFTVTDNVQITRGAHLIGFGVWFQEIQDNARVSLNIGKATFSTLSDLLRGNMQTFQAIPYGTPLGFRTFEGAWYLQDTIKVRPNLTFNLGLRHEFTNGWNEVAGRISNFILGPNGVFLNQPHIGDSMFTDNKAKWLFAPRVGLAWDPFGNGKTAIHAGFGMYHNLFDDLTFLSSRNPPFNTTVQLSNAVFPFAQITPSALPPGAQVAPIGYPPDAKTPTVVAYNLKIDQALGSNLSLSVGYSGSHGYHNIAQDDRNTVRPTVCDTTIGNCPAGLASGTLYYPAGAPRRNPLFASGKLIDPIATSNYNAMLIEVTQRARHGLSIKANYTWARALDDASSTTVYSNAASSVLNPENLKQDYGPTMFDVQQRVSVSGTYQLPFGAGKAFAGKASGVVDRVIGGWQLNGIASAQTGLPLNPQLGFQQSRNGNNNAPDRPSVNPNFSGKLYPHKVEQWFNPSAYILPPAGTYGNAARNSLRTPGLATVDASLFKNIPIRESVSLQFRAETFNLLNRPNFGAPNNLVLNPDGSTRTIAGQITTTSTTSRQLQFGLKLIW